jgi:hypothetical protein
MRARLYRILSMVLRDLYSIHPVSATSQHTLATRYAQRLKQWRDEIPGFLQVYSNNPAPLIPIFQRQRDVLNITYWHALIVIFRPLLLQNFAQIQGSNRGRDQHSHRSQIESSVSECLQAAMCIVQIVDQMLRSGLMFRCFWVGTPLN